MKHCDTGEGSNNHNIHVHREHGPSVSPVGRGVRQARRRQAKTAAGHGQEWGDCRRVGGQVAPITTAAKAQAPGGGEGGAGARGVFVRRAR